MASRDFVEVQQVDVFFCRFLGPSGSDEIEAVVCDWVFLSSDVYV